ncbi:MAG: AMP-binding protein [Desulfosporosinus sp.]|nr:AMP-binding protein [Desulfosporosinus sp.]
MTTLIGLLEVRMKENPDKEFLHIWDRQDCRSNYSYQDIYQGALKFAAYFRDKGLKPGDSVMILLLSRVEFFFVFFGVMMAGGLPIPVHPPIFILEWDEYKEKFLHIFNTSRPKFILCYADVYRSIQDKILKEIVEEERILMLEKIELPDTSDGYQPIMPEAWDCAYVQYTSGSTGLPKGAMLTHSALMNNMKAIGEKIELSSEDVAVSWLPLYHDMGLIGNFLTALYWNCTVCLIPTEFFVMQPANFFRIIQEYKATSINSPNFGYVICNKYVNHKKIANVDLSSLRLSLIGADHIDFNDMQEFNEKFAAYGLNREIFLPVYGLAEACLGVTFSELNSSVSMDYVNWATLNQAKQAVSTTEQKRDTLRVVAVGKPVSGQQVIICDNEGKEQPDEMLGEICIKSNMLMSGYQNLPLVTNEVFRDGWLRTDDLGYKRDGVFYFFERKKDLINRKGKLFRPKDFEHFCWGIQDIKRGRSVVVGLEKTVGCEDQDIYLLIETGLFYSEKYTEIIESLNELYLEELGEIPDYVYVVPRGSIPQTSSGKLQRYKCRNKIKDGSIETNFIYDNIAKQVMFCK